MILKPNTPGIDIRASYTAAGSIPVKVLLNKDLRERTRTARRLIPIHVQLLPTNRCNLSCAFCSCSERDRELELGLDHAKRIIEACARAGTKACTITGGGEPLMHPKIDEIIDALTGAGIKIGLVTNGQMLHLMSNSTLGKLTWCRISNGDDRYFDTDYREHLTRVTRSNRTVDWAFSHVVSDAPNLIEIARIVEFANEMAFTHVRLVSDLFKPDIVNIGSVRCELQRLGVNDSRVIYQGRKEHERGGDCYICFLKPLIGPDGEVYACCGAQYALAKPSRDLPRELHLGSASDIESITARSNVPLDGRICVKCYYMQYNRVLKTMLSEIEHPEFV